MSYSLDPKRNTADEIRRAARQQLNRALREIDRTELDTQTRVHQIRKRCKKLRGLLRLVREPLGACYQAENRWYRDTARLLSELRDEHQIRETLRRVAGEEAHLPDFPDKPPPRQQAATEVLRVAARRLQEGRERVADWPLEDKGFKLIRHGLQKSYAQGRKRAATARHARSAGALHQWRKAVKYHGYQLKLLRPIWPGPLKAHYRELSRLGDYLGDEHDLSVLATHLEHMPELSPAYRRDLLDRIQADREVLQRRAFGLGEKVFAEKPKRLRKRLRHYWHSASSGS